MTEMATTALAMKIAGLVYRGGLTRADSVVVPGNRPLSFAEWIDQELEPMRLALRAARPYVATCADDELPNGAAEALKLIEAVS